MGAAAIPWITGIGAAGSLFQGNQANKAARGSLGLQQQQAQRQAELFGQASPYYSQILQALAGYAGLPGIPPPMVAGPQASVDRIRGGLGRAPLSAPNMVPAPGAPAGGAALPSSFPGAQQLPYTNVTPQQLGIYANPTDALRLRAAEDETRNYTQQALHQAMFGAGQRGLYGSSIEAGLRGGIANQAYQDLGNFGRQLAINAPKEAAQRLQVLANALNPGLQAGPAAAGIAGAAAGQYAGMGQQFGGQAGNAINAYLQNQALQRTAGGRSTAYAPIGLANSQGPYGIQGNFQNPFGLQIPGTSPIHLTPDDFSAANQYGSNF